MNKWFIADTHFSHGNIIKYAHRPFATVKEMDNSLIANWNQCVDKDDQVFFLGDFGLGDVEHLQAICAQLHGHKICIRGNHDKTPTGMYRMGFDLVLESAYLKIGRHVVELIHVPSNPPPHHFQLHGHVHDKRPNKIVSNQLNLCVEVWNYKPVAEQTILSMLDKASSQETKPPPQL
jgi:calcineurin-like phosphoesterase family protein